MENHLVFKIAYFYSTVIIFTTAAVLPQGVDYERVDKNVNLCPNGEKYKDDCNTCYCDPENGRSACNNNFFCIHKFIAELCPNGTHFLEDCNSCICNPGSGTKSCTQLVCGKATNRRKRCKRGEMYKEDCNLCWCDPKDGASACTQYDCLGRHAEDEYIDSPEVVYRSNF